MNEVDASAFYYVSALASIQYSKDGCSNIFQI